MTTLVFLERHDGELPKAALGVLGKAASLGGDVAGVVARAGRRGRRRDGRRVRRGDRLRRRRRRARGAAAAAPRRRARGASSRDRAPTPCCSPHRSSPPTSPPGSPRGSKRASTGTSSTCAARAASSSARGPRSATPCSSRWGGRAPAARARPVGHVRPRRAGRAAEVQDVSATFQDFSTRAQLVEQAARGGERPVDRGRRRDRRRRPRARRARGLRALRGARRGARRRGRRDPRGRRRRLVPVRRRRSARPARRSRRSSTSRSASPARSSTRSACRAPGRSSRSTRTRTRRSSTSPTSASSATCTQIVAEADRARPGAQASERLRAGRLPAAVRELGGDRRRRRTRRRADRRRRPDRRRRARRASPARSGSASCWRSTRRRARAARRGAGRAPREGQAARLAPPLRRRDEPAGDPEAVRGPPGDRGDADIRDSPRRGRVPADEGRGTAHPAAADDDEPRELDRLGVGARPLPRRAGRGGRGDDPARDGGQKLLVEHGRVVGVRTGDKGRGKDGEPLPNFEPGVDITAS